MPVAIAAMVFGLGGLTVLAASILRTSLDQFVASLPTYNARLRAQLDSLSVWLERAGIDVPDQVLADILNPQFAMSYAGTLATALSGMLGLAVIIFIIAAFALVEMGGFDRKLRGIPGISEAQIIALEKHFRDLRRYISLKSVMCILTGALVGIWLWALGIENALFMGLIAFILNYVPTIGSVLAAVPGVLLALVTGGLTSAVIVAIGYIIINGVIGNLVEPRILGQGLGLSTLVVFLSLILWGWVLGPVGMLLSVPLTTTIKTVLESYDETRGLALLLGGSPPSGDAQQPP